MRPQIPKLSAGVEAFTEYEAAMEAWWKSPEGQDERRREEQERAAEAQRTAEVFEERRRMQVEKLIQATGMPPRALEVVMGKLDTTEALAAVDFARDILVLSGAPGCGKTVAAAAWVVEFVRDLSSWGAAPHDGSVPRFYGRPPVWVTAARLARWERYDEDKMNGLLKTPRLVIDDLGGEYMDKGGFYASLLDEIINERQGASQPTILTTNLDDVAFKARYGERIVDRIREGGRFINCGNKSLRTRAA
jgi:DNA replication protein DnaC